MSSIIYEKEDKVKEVSETLENGGVTLIKCSNCDKPLIEVWHTRPKETLNGHPLEWLIQASCCYCQDKSYITKVTGGFHPKGHDIPHPNGNPEDVIPIVNIVDIQMIKYQGKDVSLFVTEKYK